MLSFIQPEMLWLLLVIPPLLWLGWYGRSHTGRGRFRVVLVLRTLLLLALIGSLAGTQWVASVKDLTTIFLLDSSDSITPNQRAASEQFIADALKTMPTDDRAAIIVFGENALIDRLPSNLRTLARVQSVPVANRTNIEQALLLGLSLFPADTQKRLVLLSDGGENVGRAYNSLSLADDRGVVLDAVEIPTVQGAEVAVDSFHGPSQARDNQELLLQTTLKSTVAQPGLVRLIVDNTLISETPVNLITGTLDLTSTLTLSGQGYHVIKTEVIADDDTRRQNNSATLLVNIGGVPEILLIAGDHTDSVAVERGLVAAGYRPTVIDAEAAPQTIGELGNYDAVILANVPATALAPQTQSLLQTYVRDLGRGLLMLGGENSFGIGGYEGTPIEETLPVDMQLRNQEKYPPISVAIVFDISGSMGAEVGGMMKVELAAEGAARTVQLLRDFDELTVIPFDSATQNMYGPVAGSERSTAVQEIRARGVVGGGGINVHSALRAASDVLLKREFPLRHIIILADGSDSEEQQGTVELASRLTRDGITVSTIAIGNGGDVAFLRQVAAAGKGRSFLVENAANLPDIVLQETQLALAPYLVEQDFLPLLGSDSPIMAGLTNQSWPILHGMNGSQPKDQAAVILWGPEDLPLLAQWQYGLGRSVAWTSDFKGRWGKDLVNWDQFPRLLSQMVQWMLPVVSSDLVNIDTAFIGSEMESTITIFDEQNQPLSGLNLAVNVVGADGNAGSFTANEVSPGVYRGRVASPPTGTYFLQMIGTDADGQQVLQRTLGINVPYSSEYRQGQSNPLLLQELVETSGGQFISEPADAFAHTLNAVQRASPLGFWLLLAALLLLPLEIAVRRLRIDRLRDLLPARKRKPAAATVASTAGLQQAKQRAQTRMADPAPIAGPKAPSRAVQPAAPHPTTDGAPVYRPAPDGTPVYRPAPTPPLPAAPVAKAAPKPQSSPSTTSANDDLEGITDPLERLKAAKNRARRR